MKESLGQNLIKLIEQLINIKSDENTLKQNSNGMTDNNGLYIEF